MDTMKLYIVIFCYDGHDSFRGAFADKNLAGRYIANQFMSDYYRIEEHELNNGVADI
jgi:hypothetical protein